MMNPEIAITLNRHIQDGGVVLGVSGGLDSMVLLSLLAKSDVPLIAAHVNYGLRGEASDKDEEFVRSACDLLGVKLDVRKADKSAVKSGNLQENARNLRYEFYKELRDKHKLIWIATAHHQDDQTETRMLKLLRGASLKSQIGMRTIDFENHLYRPLLSYTKDQLLKFAQSEGITWRDDATNEESVYARNLLRNELFPRLDEMIPGWRANLEKLTDRLTVTDDLANRYLSTIVSDDRRRIPVAQLLSTPPATRLTLLHTFIKDHAPEATTGQLTQLNNLLQSQPGKHIQLNTTTTIWRNQHHLQINTSPDQSNTTDLPQILQSPSGHIQTPWANIRLQPHPTPTNTELRNPCKLWLNTANLQYPLSLQKWKPADTIQPLGMQGSVLVSDLLNDRNIDSHQKSEAITVSSFDGKICAVIFPHLSGTGLAGCMNDLFKVNALTSETIEISIEYHI